MDRFHELLVFRRAVETGNVTQAAEQLHVSQPAVSRTLSGLEARLGVQLLRRSKRGVAPTEAGQSLYREATDLLDRLQELEAATRDGDTALSGTVRLAAAAMMFSDVLAPILAPFSATHPGLAIDAVLGMQPIDLAAENIDLAVRGGRPGPLDMKFRKLGQVPVALYASAAYLAAHGDPATPGDLADHHLIGSPMSQGQPGWQLEREDGGAAMTLPITVRHRTNELVGNNAMVEAGMGIGLLPIYTAQRIGLARVLPAWRATGATVFVVWPASRHMPRRVRAVLDLLIEQVPAALSGRAMKPPQGAGIAP